MTIISKSGTHFDLVKNALTVNIYNLLADDCAQLLLANKQLKNDHKIFVY